MHEEVARPAAPHDGRRADEVRARPDGDGAAAGAGVLGLGAGAGGDEVAQVGEAGRAVGVREEGVEPAGVAQAVGYGAAFAAVGVQGDDAEGGVRVCGCEAEGRGDGGVGGAVGYEEDFVAGWGVGVAAVGRLGGGLGG